MEAITKVSGSTFDPINERIPLVGLTRIVIIGGGFAGVELVRALSKADVQVVLIDKHNYHSFIPLLYQVATAGLSPGDISNPLREFLKENKNFHFRMARVKRVDPDQKQIYTNIGTLQYDFLVIASGSRTNFFGNEQIQKNSLRLREISDAIEIRTRLINNFEQALQVKDERALQRHMNIVIVGAGPTGVEMAGAIGELRKSVLPKDYPELDFRRMHIYLVEGSDKVLGAMSPSSSRKAVRYLKKFGVDLLLGVQVKSYEDGVATLSNDLQIFTDCLIWAAGVKGNLIDGLREGAVERNRILVDEVNRIKNHTYVFAIGDVALQADKKYPKGLPQLAPVAIQQARHLGENFQRMLKGKEMKPFRYTDKGTMATIGRNKAVVDVPGGITIGGFTGWFVWMFVHLFSINGFRRKLLVFSNWVWNYFTYNRGNRLIINKDMDDE